MFYRPMTALLYYVSFIALSKLTSTLTAPPTVYPIRLSLQNNSNAYGPPSTESLMVSSSNGKFTLCSGFSCNGPGGILKCPDNKTQSRETTGSAGGNVFVTIIAARRLDDRDGKAIPDVGIAQLSDPYVRIKLGTEGRWSTKETDRVGNRRDVQWGESGEKLHMGWHRAGEARMQLEVLDYDTGLEVLNGRDDSLGTVSLWLPFCSMLVADHSPRPMSNRKLCREEGWLLLNSGHYTTVAAQPCCKLSTDVSCVHVAIEIVPFRLFLNDIFAPSDETKRFDTSLFVDPEITDAGILPVNGFGQPYVEKGISYTVNGEASALDASGAILLRTTARLVDVLGDAVNPPAQQAQLSVNSKATLTLCRLALCNPLPDWLEDWDYIASIQILNVSEHVDYACYQKILGPTMRDRYGKIKSNAIKLHWPQCEKNYFVVVEPHFGVFPSKQRQAHIFGRISFLIRLLQFGIPILIILPGSLNLLWHCGLRYVLSGAHLISICRDGPTNGKCRTSTLPVTLFLGDGASTHNCEFRHNHHWATLCIEFMLAMPCTFFWTSGIIVAATVDPNNVGLSLIIIGTAALIISVASAQWQLEQWRVTQELFFALTLSIGSTLVFFVVAAFGDPKRRHNSHSGKNEFMTFTMTSLLLEMVPLVFETVEFNSNLREAKNSLAMALAITAEDMRADVANDTDEEYWMMKECYSASSDSRHFDFVPDVVGNLCGLSNRVNSVETALNRRAILHASARVLLLFYVVGAFTCTHKGYLALAIAVYINIMDAINLCLDCGDTRWSTMKIVFLMALSRILIVSGGTRLWILGFSAAYVAYGFFISTEIVDRYLPHLTHLKACTMIFSRSSAERSKGMSHHNVAGNLEFVLFSLTATLFSIIFTAGYSDTPGLPSPYIYLGSNSRLPSHTCPILALLLVGCYGTTLGCVRANCLHSQGSSGSTVLIYIFAPWLNLTNILAGLAYFLLVTAGLIIWAESHAPTALAVLTLGPPCAICAYHAGKTHLTNDCQLVIWPPHNMNVMQENVHNSESGLAFMMLDKMMGSPSKNIIMTLGKLKVPEIVTACHDNDACVANIKIPTLPPESVMNHRVTGMAYDDIHKSIEVVNPRQRRQMIDLGLRARREKLHKSSKEDYVRRSTRQRVQCSIKPSLSVREIIAHLIGALWNSSIGVVTYAKVTDGSINDETDLTWFHVPLWEATVTGCLLREEYIALACAAALPFYIVTLGGILAFLAHPQYVIFHLLWVAIISIFCNCYPIFEWGVTCKVTHGAILTSICGWSSIMVFLGWVFCAWLDARVDIVEVLWVFDFIVIYTLALSGTYKILPWVESGLVCKKGKLAVPSAARAAQRTIRPRSSTGKLLERIYLNFTQLITGLLCWSIIVQMYLIGPRYGAVALSLSLAGLWTGLRVVFVWTKNEFYLPPQLTRATKMMFVCASTVATITFFALEGLPATFALSAFFVLRLLKSITQIINRVIHLESDVVFWFSPFLLPAYSYSGQKALLLDETQLVNHCSVLWGTGICWGAALVCFEQPITLGTGVCFTFTSSALAITVCACTLVWHELGIAAKLLPASIFIESAVLARFKFAEACHAESSKYEVCCDEYSGAQDEACLGKQSGNKNRNDSICKQASHKFQGISPNEASESGLSARELSAKLEAAKYALRLCVLNDELVWRADALYTHFDGIAEACASRGPFGSLCHIAYLLKTFLHPSFADFDKRGRRIVGETSEFEATQAVLHLCELEESIKRRFGSEIKSLIRFHLVVLTAKETHLVYQKLRFRKFLYDKRFQMLCKRISPPWDAMGDGSFASIDIACIATWIEFLDEDRRECFHLMRESFDAGQIDREIKTDQYDLNETMAAAKLSLQRLERERCMYAKRLNECDFRRSKRTKTWVASLSSTEQDRFTEVLERKWETDPFCIINPEDTAVRESYESYVLLKTDETVGNCRAWLAELEAGEVDCYPSKTRIGALQYVDSDFHSGQRALGNCAGATFVGTWNNALSVNPHAVLFVDGTDPDDIRPGACVNDEWLLATLSMLSAMGAVDDDNIESHIKKLFIHMVDDEGNMIHDSAVGAFGLQLFVNGQWEATVVDDTFPMLGDGSSKGGVDALVAFYVSQTAQSASRFPDGKDNGDNCQNEILDTSSCLRIDDYMQRYKDCAGFAVSHSSEMAELWVSLLEKGIAKYYGSYAAIEAGFVHQGLQAFTGHYSECNHIARASRGIGRLALWGNLLRHYQNEFILGAGAVPAEQAWHLLHASGLLFGATYTIYDVVSMSQMGLKLIKLRNPAGHVATFRGAWCRTSPLWTKFLRHRLQWCQEPQTFWMSFDEFCCCFRCIFVCHHFADKSTRWKRQTISGEWVSRQPEGELDNRERTAAGLPSPYNPSCQLERNPQYAIVVHRPTTFRFVINQTGANGSANAPMLPIAGYLCRAGCAGDKRIDRVTKLERHKIIATTGKARRRTAIDALINTLDPGNYVIVLGTFQAEMEGHFTLTIISNFETGLYQIWPPVWRS